MSLTQKYKQQQQQVRVLTNENNYIKGMYYTDVPLAEGYARTLLNFDIDSMSGSLRPRKGLQSLGLLHPTENAKSYLNNLTGFNTVVDSRVCASSDKTDPRKINRFLQAILYNTNTRSLLAATCDPEINVNNKFKVSPFALDKAGEFITIEPYVIPNPGVHNKNCIHNNFFKRPVGTFAFGTSYYTFLKHNKYTAKNIGTIPNDSIKDADGNVITTFTGLKNSSKGTGGTPGEYYVFTTDDAMGLCAYYDEDGNLQAWQGSEDSLKQATFTDTKGTSTLCYTRLGADIKADSEIQLLDNDLIRDDLIDDQYYVCTITPKALNPTEASSWGYNMLLENPYDFACETTATNMVTILGVIPYDADGHVVLTPRKNQLITLKGYYRAPAKYYSDANNARYYATTKRYVTTTETKQIPEQDENGYYSDGTHTNIRFGYIGVSGNTIQAYYYLDTNNKPVIVDSSSIIKKSVTVTDTKADPKKHIDISADVINASNYGDWWYCTEDEKYYIIAPKTDLKTKALKEYGNTQPAASVALSLTEKTGDENKIRIKWQMRSSNSADWTDISNEEVTLSEYYTRTGSSATNKIPFTITTTMPDSEVLVKLTITDPLDTTSNEELVLSTSTIGLSLVSDELANTLNLTDKIFDLGQCTGMCEWGQRLVVWGVPNALNTLFVSDVNNPGFFPYPNNVDIFTDPIIAVHNYGDELLVLTTSALYRLIWDTEGTGWTHKLVQQNLHVTEQDTYMSCVIKNMFFFKSNEYYYMMVPKSVSAAAVRGETTIAPISKPIEYLLDNFHQEVYNLIKVVVDKPDIADFTNKLVNYFSYVDNTKVVVNYVYALDDTTADAITQDNINSKYLYIQLIYDTDARTWTMRAFEAAHMLYASHVDAIQQDRFIDITPSLDGDQLVLQYYKFINVADDTIQYVNATGADVAVTRLIKNYQYLDTGNREINTELKKRFREFQFKLKNISATNLGYYTAFLIDGSIRKDLQHYNPRFISDPKTHENMVVVERTLDAQSMTYKTTRIERILVPERMLQDSGVLTPTILTGETDPDKWILDQSAFPGKTLWKVRMPITGKGFTPRAILLSTNEAEYEILGHSWVYRTMNGR